MSGDTACNKEAVWTPRPRPRLPSETLSEYGTEPLIERLRRATIGRYDIYAELGSGGMATVFLALDLALDRKVAIKVMSPSLANSPEAIERFRREARVAAALSHPNIIGIYAVGDDPDLAFYVMKFIEGRSLDSVIRDEGQQSVGFVQAVLQYAGTAMEYAHQRGVVHRDIKPANFMLDKDGWLVVTDFGIAKMEEVQSLTLSGTLVGTPFYMSPEQFNGAALTGASDQYALGIVAYELLTGRTPFHAATLAEVMRGHLLDPPPAVRQVRPDVSVEMEAGLMRMIAKEPADRFPSLADAVTEFGAMLPDEEKLVRSQIMTLAKTGALKQPRMSVPMSPVPVRAPRRPGAVLATVPPTARTHERRSLFLGGIVGAALLAGGVYAAGLWRGEANPPEPETIGAVTSTPPKTAAAPLGTAPVTPPLQTQSPAPAPVPTAALPSAPTRKLPAPTQPTPATPSTERARPDSTPQTVVASTPDTLAVDSIPEEPAVPLPPPSRIRIRTNVRGAVLLINDRIYGIIGDGRPRDIPLEPGEYVLRLSLEGCTDWSERVVVREGQLTIVGAKSPVCRP